MTGLEDPLLGIAPLTFSSITRAQDGILFLWCTLWYSLNNNQKNFPEPVDVSLQESAEIEALIVTKYRMTWYAKHGTLSRGSRARRAPYYYSECAI